MKSWLTFIERARNRPPGARASPPAPISQGNIGTPQRRRLHLQMRARYSGCVFVSALLIAPSSAKEPTLTVHETEPELIGRVTDAQLKPLSSVQLKLTSPDSAVKVSATTDSDGSFEIKHDPCKILRLEVYPPKRSGLASAWLDNLPGASTRRVIIELQNGFEISGQILGNGKGLKGLDLSLIPVDETSHKRSSVHGSGLATTGHGGSFTFIATPGLKRLTIENDRYPQYVKHFETHLNVTKSGAIPDITLANSQ
jgi:hypothetical protein